MFVMDRHCCTKKPCSSFLGVSERRRRGPKRTRSIVGDQPPFAQPSRHFAATPFVSEDELDAIHRASLRVLCETGIDILHDDARRLLAGAGARVDGDRVRFDPDMVLEMVALSPGRVHVARPDARTRPAHRR